MKTAAALGALALLTALADNGSAKRQEARMHEIAEQAVDEHSSDDGDRLGNIDSRLDALESDHFGENDPVADQ